MHAVKRTGSPTPFVEVSARHSTVGLRARSDTAVGEKEPCPSLSQICFNKQQASNKNGEAHQLETHLLQSRDLVQEEEDAQGPNQTYNKLEAREPLTVDVTVDDATLEMHGGIDTGAAASVISKETYMIDCGGALQSRL